MLSQFGPSTWVAVLLGGLLAVLAFVPVAAYRYRKAGRLRAVDLFTLLCVAVYSVALWSYTLVPLPEHEHYRCLGHNLRLFAFIGDIRVDPHRLLANRGFLQAAFNVVLFAPFGFFVRVLTRRGVVVATLAGLATSLAIELTQLTGVWGLFPCAYRLFDVDDLLLNTAGATLGSLVALPVVAMLRERRPLPAVTRVTLGRRLTGIAADVLVANLIGLPLAVAWRALALYVLQLPLDRLPGWVDALLIAGAPLLVEGYWVLNRGRTIGEAVVQLEPVARTQAVRTSRSIKLASGVGAFLVLGSVEQLGFAYLGFVLLSLGWVVWSRDHRGLSHTLARMDLIVERQPTVEPTSDNG